MGDGIKREKGEKKVVQLGERREERDWESKWGAGKEGRVERGRRESGEEEGK